MKEDMGIVTFIKLEVTALFIINSTFILRVKQCKLIFPLLCQQAFTFCNII